MAASGHGASRPSRTRCRKVSSSAGLVRENARCRSIEAIERELGTSGRPSGRPPRRPRSRVRLSQRKPRLGRDPVESSRHAGSPERACHVGLQVGDITLAAARGHWRLCSQQFEGTLEAGRLAATREARRTSERRSRPRWMIHSIRLSGPGDHPGPSRLDQLVKRLVGRFEIPEELLGRAIWRRIFLEVGIDLQGQLERLAQGLVVVCARSRDRRGLASALPGAVLPRGMSFCSWMMRSIRAVTNSLRWRPREGFFRAQSISVDSEFGKIKTCRMETWASFSTRPCVTRLGDPQIGQWQRVARILDERDREAVRRRFGLAVLDGLDGLPNDGQRLRIGLQPRSEPRVGRGVPIRVEVDRVAARAGRRLRWTQFPSRSRREGLTASRRGLRARNRSRSSARDWASG